MLLPSTKSTQSREKRHSLAVLVRTTQDTSAWLVYLQKRKWVLFRLGHKQKQLSREQGARSGNTGQLKQTTRRFAKTPRTSQ